MTQIITTDQHVKQNVQNAAILVFIMSKFYMNMNLIIKVGIVHVCPTQMDILKNVQDAKNRSIIKFASNDI